MVYNSFLQTILFTTHSITLDKLYYFYPIHFHLCSLVQVYQDLHYYSFQQPHQQPVIPARWFIPARIKLPLSRASGLSVLVLMHTAGIGFPIDRKKTAFFRQLFRCRTQRRMHSSANYYNHGIQEADAE